MLNRSRCLSKVHPPNQQTVVFVRHTCKHVHVFCRKQNNVVYRSDRGLNCVFMCCFRKYSTHVPTTEECLKYTPFPPTYPLDIPFSLHVIDFLCRKGDIPGTNIFWNSAIAFSKSVSVSSFLHSSNDNNFKFCLTMFKGVALKSHI